MKELPWYLFLLLIVLMLIAVAILVSFAELRPIWITHFYIWISRTTLFAVLFIGVAASTKSLFDGGDFDISAYAKLFAISLAIALLGEIAAAIAALHSRTQQGWPKLHISRDA